MCWKTLILLSTQCKWGDGNPLNLGGMAPICPIYFSLTIVQECFDLFCRSSKDLARRKQKSNRNIHYSMAAILREMSGFTIISLLILGITWSDLGNYLGVPLHHKRISRNSNHFKVDNVQKRLSTWKLRNLFLASRVTLIKAVLNIISIHYMQIVLIPEMHM